MTRASVEQFTEQLGHLISLSRVIDRNRDDAAFEVNGGEIIYVFDTNVVQMFLEPYKNPQYCEVFHKSYWSADRELDREVNAQACLLAAEYLMSGKLPGQRLTGRWYMTRGHKAELDRQEKHLREQIADNVRRMRAEESFREEVLEDVATLNAALEIDPAGDRAGLELLAARPPYGASSLRELRALNERQFRQRAAGIRAREVCRILARDEIAEPANQLFRYRSGEIAGRYLALEDYLQLTGAEKPKIDDEIAEWRTLLGEVLKRRPNNNKTREGFRADCEALGLISWAWRQPQHRSRRIVLVTGDAIILEAYRQRHAEERVQSPYLVRPINHFAPLFNPVSAQSVLSSQQYAFLKLQEVIEVVLVDLNLQLLLTAERETRLRARDAFVLQVEQNIDGAMKQISTAFPQVDDNVWLRKRQNALESVVQELRPIERLMLEAFPNLVAPRLKIERPRFEQASRDGGEALLDAIEARLAAASRIGAQFSLQTMPNTLARLFDEFWESQEAHERRATVHIRLTFAENDPDVGYEVAVEQLRALPSDAVRRELEKLTEQPAKIFALAALLAFRLEIWKDATRYAELAATASRELAYYSDKADLPTAEHFEYLYLMAASLRFRLAEFEPSAAYAYSDPWSEWLKTANEALRECVEYHEKAGQLTRALRARSELAALHIGICEWVAFSTLRELNLRPTPVERATTSFFVTASELHLCEKGLAAALVHAIEADSRPDGPSQQMLVAVKRQFRSNVHAAWLTARRLLQLWPELADDIVRARSLLPEPQFDDDWPEGPTIARIYSAAVRGEAAELAALRAETVKLPLDRTVLEGLITLLSTPEA